MGPADSRGVMGAAKENDPARPSEGTCLCFLPGGNMAGMPTARCVFRFGGERHGRVGETSELLKWGLFGGVRGDPRASGALPRNGSGTAFVRDVPCFLSRGKHGGDAHGEGCLSVQGESYQMIKLSIPPLG